MGLANSILGVKMDTKTLKNLEELSSSKGEILYTLIPHERLGKEIDRVEDKLDR